MSIAPTPWVGPTAFPNWTSPLPTLKVRSCADEAESTVPLKTMLELVVVKTESALKVVFPVYVWVLVVVTLAPMFDVCVTDKDDASAIFASKFNAPEILISPTPSFPPTTPENWTSSPELLIVISLLVELLESTVLPKATFELSVVKIVLPVREVAPL